MCRIVCSIFIMALFLSCTPAAKTRYERVKQDLVEYYDEIGETEKVAAAGISFWPVLTGMDITAVGQSIFTGKK